MMWSSPKRGDQSGKSSSPLRRRKQINELKPVQHARPVDLYRNFAVGQPDRNQESAPRRVFAVGFDRVECLRVDAGRGSRRRFLGETENDRIGISHCLTDLKFPVLSRQDVLVPPHGLAGSNQVAMKLRDLDLVVPALRQEDVLFGHCLDLLLRLDEAATGRGQRTGTKAHE